MPVFEITRACRTNFSLFVPSEDVNDLDYPHTIKLTQASVYSTVLLVAKRELNNIRHS